MVTWLPLPWLNTDLEKILEVDCSISYEGFFVDWELDLHKI